MVWRQPGGEFYFFILLVDLHYYSQLSLNPYSSVDGPGYGLSGVMDFERSILVQNDNSVDSNYGGVDKSRHTHSGTIWVCRWWPIKF